MVQREFEASLRHDGMLAVKRDLSKLAFEELPMAPTPAPRKQ